MGAIFAAMMQKYRVPLRREVEEAKHSPNGWVYRIAGSFGPDEGIPPEAIVGAWKVDANGRIVGEGSKKGQAGMALR